MLSWSMTPWRSLRTTFGWLTFAPAAGRRAPADRIQILDAPRNATAPEILRQNETACSFRQGRAAAGTHPNYRVKRVCHCEMPFGWTPFKRQERPSSAEIRDKVDATRPANACQRCYGILKDSEDYEQGRPRLTPRYPRNNPTAIYQERAGALPP